MNADQNNLPDLQLFEHMPYAVFVADAGTGIILMVNEAACRLMGYSRERLVGLHQSRLHPARMEAYVRSEFNKGRTKSGEVIQVEGMVLRSDGTEVPVEVTASGFTLSGREVKAGVFRDITRRMRIENELHEQERRFYSLLDSVNLISVMLNTRGEIVFCNQFLLDLSGWHMEEVLQKNWFDLFVQDSAVKEVFQQALENNAIPVHFENRIKTRSGEERMILWNNTVHHDLQGRVIGTASIGEDITERKQAETKLRRSEERYRDLFENAIDPIFIINEHYQYEDVNNRAIELFGYSRDEFRAMKIFDLMPPDQVPRSEEELQKLKNRGSYEKFVGQARTKDGRWLDIEVSSSAIFKDGKLAGSRDIVRDITERKRAEALLRRSERRFRTVFEKAAIGMVVTDRSRRIIDCNNTFQRMLGYSHEELLGKKVPDISVPEDETINQRLLREALENRQELFSMEKRYYRKDGSIMQSILTVSLIPREGDADEWIIGIVEDITERRRLEESLLNMQKLESVGVLAGGIAHDFNNLLTAIIGNISLSKMQVPAAGRVDRLLTEAEAACAQAKDLSYRLLTFSKGGEPVKRKMSVVKLLRETVPLSLSGSNISVEFELGEITEAIQADEGQIKQVINNLVMNAKDAMPAGGVVRVRAGNVVLGADEPMPIQPGPYVKISVIDEGSGIPAEHFPRLFDPYFSTKEFSSERGRGLGLAICHSIVRKHGGMITVESLIGKGATFHVFLPAALPAQCAVESGGAAEMVSRIKGRVLVVDDEERVRTIVQNILIFLEYDVECARDGDEAVALYRSAQEAGARFDLVLLDLTIPGGMGGTHTLGKLREIDPGVRAIVSSGYVDDPAMKDCKSFGFVSAIPKPYNAAQLDAVFRTVLKSP